MGPNTISQTKPHPHQALLDPTCQFFVVPDLGTDRLHIISTANDSFDIVDSLHVGPSGNGPRHGVFYPPRAAEATHFFLVSELTNVVTAFRVVYRNGRLEMAQKQQVPTHVNLPDGTAAAEIMLSMDGTDLYVTSRYDNPFGSAGQIKYGGNVDSISQIKITEEGEAKGHLDYLALSSSGGETPRHAYLDEQESIMLVSNTKSGHLLAVYYRDYISGKLSQYPVAALSNGTEFEHGPSYARFVDTYPTFT